jgi:hypothetical protein
MNKPKLFALKKIISDYTKQYNYPITLTEDFESIKSLAESSRSPFLNPSWLTLLKDSNWAIGYLQFSNELILPFAVRRQGPFTQFHSLPFETNGLLKLQSSITVENIKHYNNFITTFKDYFDDLLIVDANNILSSLNEYPSIQRAAYILNLPANLSSFKVIDILPRNLQRNLNEAEQHGLSLNQLSKDFDYHKIYDLHMFQCRLNKRKPHPEMVYKTLVRSYLENRDKSLNIFLAAKDKQIHGYIICFSSSTEMMLWDIGYSQKGYEHNVSTLLIANAISEASLQNIHKVNFGCSPHLFDSDFFKQRWGCTIHNYNVYCYQKPLYSAIYKLLA